VIQQLIFDLNTMNKRNDIALVCSMIISIIFFVTKNVCCENHTIEFAMKISITYVLFSNFLNHFNSFFGYQFSRDSFITRHLVFVIFVFQLDKRKMKIKKKHFMKIKIGSMLFCLNKYIMCKYDYR
jgi:hypothetical protein